MERSRSSVQTRKARSLPREIISILAFACGVFVAASLVTFNPDDPSFLAHSARVASNACGWLGAYLASVFFVAIGMAAFLVPIALFLLAANIHRKEGFLRVFGLFAGLTVAVMAMTVFITLQGQYWPYKGNLMLTGGAFGAWVGSELEKPLNSLGGSILALVVFVLALVISTPVSISNWIANSLGICWAVVVKAIRILAAYIVYGAVLLARQLSVKAFKGIYHALEKAAQSARNRAQTVREEPVLAAEPPPMIPLPELAMTDEVQLTGDEPIDLEAIEDEPERVAVPQILENQPDSPKTAKQISIKRKIGSWRLPAAEFLKLPPKVDATLDRNKLIENSHILRKKLADFGIPGEVTAVKPGPVITLYEFKPGPGIKVSKIASLADDLSMALSAENVRILAPLPGKAVVGIEIPSENRECVYLREFLQQQDFYGARCSIPLAMGKDISGLPVISDLARMPHLLCAGQTGSGKSVFMNNLICSLLYRFTPDELRLILVDPKYIEFRSFQDIPHLLLPVVDDPEAAAIALKWSVREMERRYRILAALGVKNLAGFNQKVDEMGAEVVHDLLVSEENETGRSVSGTGGDWQEAFERDETDALRVGRLPYVVIIIDELADLMMVARKEVEISVARLAQKARAAGIHLIIATQRPSTDVLTGLIKANLPSRVSFQLASYIDSKTILDRAGAERLLGSGDMLFSPPGSFQLKRLHGALVEDSEIEKITSFLRSQGEPVYREEILIDDEDDSESESSDENSDELFSQATDLVKRSGHASASFLQRHLKVGYNRAARMIETMEARGIVGPADGARPREVLLR